MAEPKTITTCLETLFTCGLRFTPTKRAAEIAKVWIRILEDVGDDELEVAVERHIRDSEEWPSPASILKAVKGARGAYHHSQAAPASEGPYLSKAELKARGDDLRRSLTQQTIRKRAQPGGE